MPLIDLRSGQQAAGVTSVNGDIGPAVNLDAQDVGAVSNVQSTENCLDNTTTQIVIGSSSTKEVFFIDYVFELNVSFKKQVGKIVIAYDPDEAAIIFDHEEGVVGAEIAGLTIDGNENAGNLRVSVDLNSVGENAKFKYTVKSTDQIV